MADFLFRLMRVLIVLGIALGAAFWLFNARQAQDKKEVVPPSGVNVVVVTPHPQTMAVEAFGTVVPRTKVNLAAEVAGRIDYIHPSFRAGGRFWKMMFSSPSTGAVFAWTEVLPSSRWTRHGPISGIWPGKLKI